MRTIDINVEHQLALVQDLDPRGNGLNTRYVPLSEADEKLPCLEVDVVKQIHLGQHHYVASHEPVGLMVGDRLIDDKKPPREGWARWKAAPR